MISPIFQLEHSLVAVSGWGKEKESSGWGKERENHDMYKGP